MNVRDVAKFIQLRAICARAGSVDNPHNRVLIGGYRCATCGLGRDGSIVFPADPVLIPNIAVVATVDCYGMWPFVSDAENGGSHG